MKNAPTSRPASWAAQTASVRLSRRDPLAHHPQDLVAAGLDAEEDGPAAGPVHARGGGPVDAVDAREALPGEAQAAPLDLVADGDDPLGAHREDVVGERDAVVTERQRLLDLVDHALGRALTVGGAEHDVAAELAGERAAAAAHHGGDGVAVAPPSVADVGGVGQQVAGGEGERVEVGGEGPRRSRDGGAVRRRDDDAGHDARVGPGRVRGEDLDHGLLALAAHDHVEVRKEPLRLARRQGAAGHEQVAAAAQLPREPHRVVAHGRHAVDADHVRPGGERQPAGALAAQERAVEESHLVAGAAEARRHVRRSERRKAEARAVERAAEERIDEEDRAHERTSPRAMRSV